MSFWDTHTVADGGGIFLSKEEKEALAESEQPFAITGINYEPQNQFGPRYVLTLELPDPVTGDQETKKLGFVTGSNVESRDKLLKAMYEDHFEAGEEEPIPAYLTKRGNAYVILPAPQA